MKKTKHRTKMKLGKSERGLKIVAVVVSLIFAAAMLYPMIFAVSSAMKDNKKIYEIPPKLLPDAANSLSVVLDYSEVKGDEKELKDKMLQDNIVTMFGVSQKMQEDSIMEIKVYGVKDGETVFYSRAHQMKLQMEKDYGIYKGTAIKTKVLLYGDRYIRACDSIGYEFDMNGVSEKAPEGLGTKFSEKVAKIMDEKYQTTGELVSVGDKVKNFLNLESFKYYLQMPAYIYPESEAVQNFGFMTFVFNSIIVIGFAMVSQVILCSVCAFVISRKLSKRAGQFVLLFFLGPGSYFEAAELDGAGSFYLYTRICMPLSKPIISLIALQTFIGNWNDFFWAWLVTEDQKLWTLNVALYNISNNVATKQNALMGLAVVTITPVILLSILFSKQLKQSIVASGVKG